MKPGEATFEPSGDDKFTLRWEGRDGTLHEHDLSLREAAELQAGKAVSGYNRERQTTLRQRIVALQARNDQIKARMDELRRQYPGIDQDGSNP